MSTMADLLDGKGLSLMRSRPTVSLRSVNTTYSSLDVDEIELGSDHGILPTTQPNISSSRTWPPAPIESISKPSWMRMAFWKATWTDVKEIPLLWLGRRFVSHFLPLALVGCLAYVVYSLVKRAGGEVDDPSVCQPDGSFDLSILSSYNPWSRSAVFTIDIKFGNLPFDTAKLIDVIWDVFVGRGGQSLLAFYSYLAFTKALSRTMEKSIVTHDIFSAVTLQHNTITSVFVLIKNAHKMGGLRARFALVWTIFAASFVLFSSTWLSAMTGYTADIQAYVSDSQNALVAMDHFQPTVYVIHDASRFNNSFQDNHMITVPWQLPVGSDISPGYSCYELYYDPSTVPKNGTIDFSISASQLIPQSMDCKWMWAVSKYVNDWGFWATSTARNTTFQKPDASNLTTPILFDPPLNISAYPVAYPGYDMSNSSLFPWWSVPYGAAWKDPNTNQYPYNQSDPTFWYDTSNTVYNLGEMNYHGSCQQVGQVRYQWGFSFVLLFAFTITLMIWAIGTYILYIDSWLNSSLDLVHRRMGPERAVLDMAQAMQTKLNMDVVEQHGNSELRVLVKDNVITYSDLALRSPHITRRLKLRLWWRNFSVKQWMKAEKWWLAAFFVFSIMWLASLIAMFSPYSRSMFWWPTQLSWLPGTGIMVVLSAGRNAPSRWLFFAFFLLTFLGLDIWWNDYLL